MKMLLLCALLSAPYDTIVRLDGQIHELEASLTRLKDQEAKLCKHLEDSKEQMPPACKQAQPGPSK